MFVTYLTRNGEKVTIIGISNYMIYGKECTIYYGTVNGKQGHWDHKGRYSPNQFTNPNTKHALDMVSWIDEVITDPGVYYIETKKEKINARKQ